MASKAGPAGPGRGILGTLFLIVFIDLVGFGMVVTLLPRYGELYAPSATTLGVFMSTYSFFQFLFAPLLGRLSDRFGRRPVLLASLLGATFAYVLLGAAGSLAALFVSRMVAGASAGNISAAQAVIADTTGPEGRARGMGVIGAAFGLGFIVGPALGGVLYDWSHAAPGYAAAATSFVALVLTWFLLPETHRLRDAEARRRAPLDLRSLESALRHPALGLCLAAFFLAVLGFAAFESSFVLYCASRFGLTASQNGWLFLYVGVLSAIVQGGLIGPLTRRFGEGRLAAAGLLLAGLALAVLPALPTIGLMAGSLALLAIGVALVNPSLSSLASRLVDPDEVGGVLGIYQGMGSLARIAGPFAGVVVFKDLGPAWPFWLGALLHVAAWSLALLLLVRLRRLSFAG